MANTSYTILQRLWNYCNILGADDAKFWPILFISLLVFQNRMAGILRNLPPLQWFLLLLTALIGIIGLLRILIK